MIEPKGGRLFVGGQMDSVNGVTDICEGLEMNISVQRHARALNKMNIR